MKTLHTIYNNFAKRNMTSLRLLLVMLLTLTVSAEVWADYTITFNTSTGTEEVTTKDAIIDDGDDYVSSVSASKTYAESDGLRYGSSSAMGYTTFTLSNTGQIQASKIIFQGAKYYSSDNSSLQYTITYTDASTTSGTIDLTSTATNKEATLESSKTINIIDIRKTADSKKRFYVQGVTVVAASAAPSHTITATSNNDSFGTVSVSGTTITATPETGYRVSTSNPYKVTEGTATVVDNGDNTFTVTPESDCTVQINFEAIPTHKIHFNTGGLTTIASVDVQESETYSITEDPSSSLTQDCEFSTFVGWTKSNSIDPSVEPELVTSVDMETSDITLYAVYSKTEGDGGNSTVTFNFADIAEEQGWEEETNGHDNITISPINIYVDQGTSNYNGRWWSDNTWRIYSGNTIIITSTAGGITNVSSNLSSVSFSINDGEASFAATGTYKFTNITVTYSGGGTTTYSLTPNCCTALAEVTDLVFSNITNNSITVEVPNGYSDKANASGYTFNCYSALTGGTLVATADESGTSHTFTDLTKNTTYYFTVVAKGEGDYCNSPETSPRESAKTLDQYTVTLNPDGGTGTFTGWINVGDGTYTQTVDAGTSITLPTPTKTDYDFAGWHDGTSIVSSSYTPTSTITLTAQWTAIEYTITYENLKGATHDNPATYTVEDAITFTAPTANLPDGYNFTEWVPASISAGSTGNKTVTAQWTEKPLTRYRTDCDACIPLDGYAEIHGTYHFFPGETITLTVTPPADDVPYTYQWQKKVNSDYENIEGETGLTYTKKDATTSDVGHYRCVVSSEGYCDLTPKFDVKCLQLYVYWDDKSDKSNQAFTKVDGTTATTSIKLEHGLYTYYFKITDGCGNWYGNTGTMESNNCTNWSMNANAHCGLTTTKLGTYVFTVDYSELTKLRVSVTYPSGNQEAGKVIYWDNNVLTWTHSNNADGTNKIYYRIGHGDHNNKTAMTLVPGTANLYKVTTSKYDNFDVWHVANNGCWSDHHSIYRTNTGDKWAATQATAFEPNPVTASAITVTPTTEHSTGNRDINNNCEFYNYDITEGMKTWNAKIVEPTNGTITVSYTHHDGTEVNDFTSGDIDLAHTCLLTITATPDAGYKLGTLTVNNVAFTSGDEHTLTADAVIKAEYAKATYTVTFDGNGADGGSTASISGEYQAEVTLTPNGFNRTGYTFTGWNTKANGTGDSYEDGETFTIPSQNITLYAQWAQAYTITWKVAGVALEGDALGDATTIVNPGDGITDIPTTPPADNTLEDCGATKFMGWSTVNIGSIPQTDAPDDLFTTSEQAQELPINGNKTFYAVFASAEGEPQIIFNETFNEIEGTGGNDDKWSGSIATTSITTNNTDNSGWTFTKAYNAKSCIKLASSGDPGSAITPALTALDGDAILTFKAGAWNSDNKGLNLSISGDATLSPTSVTMKNNEWTEYAVNIENGSSTSKITFASAKSGSNRFFLDEVKIISITYSNYVTQCCTDWTPTLTYSKTTLDSETNETATPTITGNTHNAQVSFESSNESVLTVDANNGTITAVGAGKATITATWAKTDDYCAKSITTDEITVNGKFLVTFHANDGSGNTTTQQIPSNTATALKANTFQRDGYTFQGWATSASGAKVYDDGQEVTLSTSGLDLYAVWQVKAYNITTGTITGEGTITTSPANSANCDAQVTITATPAAHYTLASVTVTRDDNSQTVDVVGNKFTMPASDVTITAEFTENEKFAINYAIPTGGGEVADDAPTWIYSDGSITLPGIKDGTISSEYSCEEFIGWTTLTSYESYEGAMPTPFYNAGDELSGITEATTLRPVYKRNGDGPSGTVELTCTDVATWKSDVLSGNNNSYGTVTTRTATDGSAWTTNGLIQNAGGISLKENYYIQIPTLPGPMTTITMKVSQQNIGSGEDACTENVASATSRTFYFRSKADGSNLFSSNSVAEASRSRTIEISDGNYTTGYIINGEGTSHVHAITVAYGSPNIISTSLNCSNDIDEFTITYNTNYGSARGQIPTGTVVNGVCDNSGEPIRFEDLPNGEYTICNSLTATQYKLVGWNSQANGNGGLSYEPGDVITMVPQSDITLYAQWVPEVIMLDNQDRTITYQETVGEAITLPAGAYTCDGKYTFVGWTTDNVDSWNQKITKPTLVAELNGNDETLFVPTEPTVVYAVYKLETTANSKAFYLKSDNNYYAQKHDTYVLTGTDDIADATRLYRQQINVESPNNYWLYYLDDEQQKRFVYINTASLGSLFSPSIGDGETTPEDTKGWEFVSVTGGYKLKALGTYGNSVGIVTHYMHTNESGNMRSNTTGSVYTIETATEINYYAYPTCSDEITITFETRGGTLIPNDHPYVLTKKEGDVITLPGCEYAGLDFIGWVNEPIEPTEIIANSEDIYEAEEEYVVGDQNIVLYAYYSQTPESAEYDGNSDGEWKIYAYADGEYHFAVAPNSEEDDMSTVTICDKSTTWTFTNVAENQYYIQDEAGRYVGVRPAIENKNDFRFTDEPVIWTIESKGNDLYRLTCETNTDRVMLYDNGSIRYSSHTQEGNPYYFYVTIGGCFNPIYTTDPARLQAVSVYGTVQITSTFGQTVKAMDKLTLVVRHAEPESYIRFSSPNVTFYDESGNVITTALVESQKQQIPLVVAYTPDVADNRIVRPAITVTAKTLNPSTGTYVETNYSVNGRISARSLPADFAIVAKVGNLWYALPSQGLNSTDALVGYPVEVDNQNDPTAVTAVPENVDWSLRQVYAASHSDAQKDRFKLNGANIMFENNASPAKMLNASASNNYLLTNAEYDSYKQSDNQGLYEWTPTTTDLETYTLTNAGRTDKKLNVSVNTVFGVHAQNVATNNLRFLPIDDRYTPLALQVVEWKENSIVVMYNGDPAQTASVSVNGGEEQPTTLSAAQRDIAVYELKATGLAANPTQRLSITIGTEKLLLPIPYIVNSNTTDATLTSNNKTLAAVSDLVVLNGKTFTADAATASKYTFRNVTVYGGGKLIIPSGKGLGVNSLTMRAGGITDAGEYDYVYPQFELRGTFTNSAAKINYDYITDYDHWFHLVLPFAGDLGTIKYPTEFYGANVAANNTGSWQIKRYDGAIRATGNYNAWVDIETEGETYTIAGQGYIFWGAPKIVSVNGGASTRQKWGIQRITMSVTAPNAMTAENGDKAISELSSYANVPNNSGKDNDQGWNLIGNPYMVNLKDMATAGLHACKLVEVIDPATGKWNGQWEWNNETDIRYLTIPSDHFDTYTAKTVAQSVPLVPGRAFFVQLEGEANAITFAAANRASLMPALRAANDKPVDIETGIILSNEILQDEVNFWIKDGKTNDYEYNADYPKTPNNNQFNIYGVHTNGDLSWVATGPEYAAESMPIGYQVPAAGTYMLSLSEIYNSDGLDALYVTDHALSPEVTVDIMSEPYEFSVNQAETNNERFTVSVRVKAKTENGATGLGNVGADGEQIHKFIYQDKIYILHHGVIYDATGKRVITINK